MTSDMGWLKTFVDERIAAAHRETGAAPNTVHGGVVVDRYGHVINGMAGSGGGGTGITLIAIANRSADITKTGGSFATFNFDDVVYDPDGTVSPGSTTWNFVPPSDGWYRFTLFSLIYPSGPIGALEKLYWQLWSDASGTQNQTVDWYQSADGDSGTLDQLTMGRSREMELTTADAARLKFGNGTGSSVSVRGNGTEYGATRIVIEKLAASATGGLGVQLDAAHGAANITTFLTDFYTTINNDPFSQGQAPFVAAVNMTVTVDADVATSGVTTWAGGDSLTLDVYVNAVYYATLDSKTGPDTGDWSLSGTEAGIVLSAGDYIDITLVMSHASTEALSPGGSYIITRTA